MIVTTNVAFGEWPTVYGGIKTPPLLDRVTRHRGIVETGTTLQGEYRG